MKMKNMCSDFYRTIACAVAVFITSCEDPQENKKQSHQLSVPNIASIAEGTYINKELVSVTFGEKTVSIGKNAFKGNKIKNLVLPSSLKIIEEGAFEHNAIKTLDLPSDLERIGENAFKGNALEEVTFNSNKVKQLSAEIFKNKDGTLPRFLLPNKKVMEHVINKFVTTNADGTKKIADDVKFKSKDEDSLSQKIIDDYIKSLTTEKENPSEDAKDSDERADIPSELCALRFIVDEKEHHKAVTSCGTSIAAKDIPSTPKKTHYTFYVWSNKQVEFGTDPVGGIPEIYLDRHTVTKTEETLYARWKPKEYKVQFMRDDSTKHKAVNIAYKQKIVKSDVDNPRYEHYIFENWYKDTVRTQQFNFDVDTIEGPTTLYAKRTPKKYEVTFVTQRRESEGITITVDYGSTIPSESIPPKPTWKGVGHNTFENWYKDTARTQRFNFDIDTIEKPTTLYVKWKTPYHVMKMYAVYEYNFEFDVNEKNYESYKYYEHDYRFPKDVVHNSAITSPKKPKDLDSNLKWPTKWFKVTIDKINKEKSTPSKESGWIKAWLKNKDIISSDKLDYLIIDRFKFKKDTITENTLLLGIMRANYKATFIVDNKKIGSFSMRYKKNNKITKMLGDNKIDIQTTIPEGFDASNARFDGWYKKTDYLETKKERCLNGLTTCKYKKHFNNPKKYISTLKGTYDATMHGRWIKTYTVQYKYKENTKEKTFKDKKENESGLIEPVHAKPDDTITNTLGFEKDKPTTKAPSGYKLTFCWYSDKALNTVYRFSNLTQPTTTVYGAWKFAVFDSRISRIDCSDTQNP